MSVSIVECEGPREALARFVHAINAGETVIIAEPIPASLTDTPLQLFCGVRQGRYVACERDLETVRQRVEDASPNQEV